MNNKNESSLNTIDPIEVDIFSCINQGLNTYEQIVEALNYSEALISNVLGTLVVNNVLKLHSKKYSYVDNELNKLGKDDYLVLDGNILLPCSIIKIPERNIMYVTRGNWYELPLDFDVRRIIWNIKFVGEKNNSTLAELIRTSVLKERKGKVKHLPEYDQLKNKVVPYSDNIGLLITAVGETRTAVNVMFYVRFEDTLSGLFKGFSVPTEIDTKQLIDELQKPIEERNYQEAIELNKLYSLEDFIFAKNEIPIELEDDKLLYVKITGIRNGYELTYYQFNTNSGTSKKIEIETFDSLSEVLSKIKNFFEAYTHKILSKSDIYVELDD